MAALPAEPPVDADNAYLREFAAKTIQSFFRSRRRQDEHCVMKRPSECGSGSVSVSEEEQPRALSPTPTPFKTTTRNTTRDSNDAAEWRPIPPPPTASLPLREERVVWRPVGDAGAVGAAAGGIGDRITSLSTCGATGSAGLPPLPPKRPQLMLPPIAADKNAPLPPAACVGVDIALSPPNDARRSPALCDRPISTYRSSSPFRSHSSPSVHAGKVASFVQQLTTHPRRLPTPPYVSRPSSADHESVHLPPITRAASSVSTRDQSTTPFMSSRLSVMSIELEDKRKTIHALRKALDLSRRRETAIEQEVNARLQESFAKEVQRYESTLERHLRLIDRLLADKKELTKRCEQYACDIKAIERRYEAKIENIQGECQRELDKQRRGLIQAEKARREAWEQQKKQEIKQITIKGLEPEIDRLMDKHRKEKHELERKLADQLEETKKELAIEYQEKAKTLRAKLDKEYEESIEEERKHQRRRLREQFETFEKQLSEERSAHATAMLSERQRWEDSMRDERRKVEDKIRADTQHERMTLEAKIAELTEKTEEAQRRQANELKQRDKQMAADRDDWQREFSAKLRKEHSDAIEEMRAQMEEDKKKEIAAVREQLKEQTTRMQDSHARHLSAEMDRAKREWAEERAALQERVHDTGAKLQASVHDINELRERLAKEEVRALEAEREKSTLADRLKCVESAMSTEQSRHAEKLQAAKQHFQAAEERLKTEMTELQESLEREQERAARELDEHRQGSAETLKRLEEKVRAAVDEKDQLIADLSDQLKAAEITEGQLRAMLETQREELLGTIITQPPHTRPQPPAPARNNPYTHVPPVAVGSPGRRERDRHRRG
ncbi:unnamed protein product [Vitrella brassicaformis CCMP3155]|uniref:Uncharacterized protein n=1 Tax=Vitrella brassicaformis (strain CCMP3155) TaxID=1169540 RepID=A0A0G4EBP7_VITBC|nr:unnamed protein product [Vitrella brassicaformis CCMP3155]|eukprot:CEL92722.1 unnamed protein product [Vitrella brassicaformis CCMP3155]